MPDRPFVTVVTPLYNKRSTVARTVESILSQTFGDFEALVVDDGSTDGGAELVEARFSDSRVRVVRQANAGPGAAKNHGLALARGELVTFLDADDRWRPELLERATTYLAAHPEAAAFTSAFYLEPAGTDRWDPLRAAGFSEGLWRLSPHVGRDELRECMNAFHPCTAVYRREVARRYGGFYVKERCTLGEDVYLWAQILVNHPIYRHLEPLAHYHMEDSELGIGGRRGELPLEPVFTDPEPVRAVCPPLLRRTFELWLAEHAITAAFLQLERGSPEKAAWLVRRFPTMTAWPADYLKLRARMASPGLWRLLKRIARR